MRRCQYTAKVESDLFCFEVCVVIDDRSANFTVKYLDFTVCCIVNHRMGF